MYLNISMGVGRVAMCTCGRVAMCAVVGELCVLWQGSCVCCGRVAVCAVAG